MNENETAAPRSYIAFISYRHKPLDKQAAELLERRIERCIKSSLHRYPCTSLRA